MTLPLLQYLWNYKIFNHFDFKDTEGNALQMVDFGICNPHNSEEVQYAKVRVGAIVFSGHIKLHLRSSDWQPEEDEGQNVILHAVYHHDKEVDFLKKRNIPTLELQPYINDKLVQRYQALSRLKERVPYQDLFSAPHQSEAFHQEMVLRKLEEKSEKIAQQLLNTKNDYEAVLFHNIAYGFGLKANAEAFQSIAESLDFFVFRKISKNLTQLEAFLLGRAGLLVEVEDAQSQLWQREYQFIRQKFSLKEAVFPVQFHQLRPPNFPTLRLSQLAVLYHQHQHLFSKIIKAHSYEDLKAVFKGITSSEYWQHHYNIGKRVEAARTHRLSHSFVDLLIINVVLPIKYAYHKANNENIAEALLKIYQDIPAEKNSIIEEWKSLGCKVQTALHSQSYLYQYKKAGLSKASEATK